MKNFEEILSRFSRRTFLRLFAAGTLAVGFVPELSGVPHVFAASSEGGNILILYFSHSGNTRTIAEYISHRIGGDLVEVRAAAPYPADYDTVVAQAKQELQNDVRPQIDTTLSNIDKYDTIFIGFPIWWGTMPMPMFTLLEQYNLGNKTVVPFCTHEGSRFGRSERDLRRLCPNARILEGFEVRGTKVGSAQTGVDAWLREVGLLRK